ncbi:MBOAT, membrane-bound O-acyltransferase family-domain-containing protein [Sporodiniella umbellata]|nr:MBOAT, membrane-bound O-acyltransferase family-domain-containing protein [Sporodiniella umbellata]
MSPAPSIKRSVTEPHISNEKMANPIKSDSHRFKFSKQRPLFFKARQTQFDLSNADRQDDTFKGFYTLFWIAMGFYVIQSIIHCYEQEGIILSLGFFRLISEDGFALLISDLTMVSMTLFSVLFSKLFLWNVLPYDTVGFIVQHVCQAAFLFFNIYWTFLRHWPWVQSGFFTMHTIVMMMKMHSYTTLNGDLSLKLKRLNHLKSTVPQKIAKGEDDMLEEMEEEMRFLEEEMVHGNTRFPNNVTLLNYLDYLLVPSLVYWMEYPRTDKIRVWYVFEKTVATIGSFLILYVTTERLILPKLYNPDMSEPRIIIELLFPFMINYLFIFYIIFECILNGFAELSRFADRNFYDDWWNSVSYDEFARKWNKPVHHWLLRHVYSRSIDSYQLSKTNATFVTFLLSSLIHELVLIIVTKKVRLYMFVVQMLQLPLIVIGRMPIFKNRFWLGNSFFWVCMMFGPPLLGILYCREAIWATWAK